MIIDTNLDDFDDGRIPTDVQYESDNGYECELKVDLMNGDLSDRRPLSASKRERSMMSNAQISKQASGNLRRRGSTPPQLRRGGTSSSLIAAQPFMSTTNKRALEIKAKINAKLEGAF